MDVYSSSNGFSTSEAPRQDIGSDHVDNNELAANQLDILELETLGKCNNNNHHEMMRSTKEEFPPSPSYHQSILVSLSTRCVRKETVCEWTDLFQIKYLISLQGVCFFYYLIRVICHKMIQMSLPMGLYRARKLLETPRVRRECGRF